MSRDNIARLQELNKEGKVRSSILYLVWLGSTGPDRRTRPDPLTELEVSGRLEEDWSNYERRHKKTNRILLVLHVIATIACGWCVISVLPTHLPDPNSLLLSLVVIAFSLFVLLWWGVWRMNRYVWKEKEFNEQISAIDESVGKFLEWLKDFAAILDNPIESLLCIKDQYRLRTIAKVSMENRFDVAVSFEKKVRDLKKDASTEEIEDVAAAANRFKKLTRQQFYTLSDHELIDNSVESFWHSAHVKAASKLATST